MTTGVFSVAKHERCGPASGSLKQRLPSDLGGRSFELWLEAVTLDATEGGGSVGVVDAAG